MMYYMQLVDALVSNNTITHAQRDELVTYMGDEDLFCEMVVAMCEDIGLMV